MPSGSHYSGGFSSHGGSFGSSHRSHSSHGSHSSGGFNNSFAANMLLYSMFRPRVINVFGRPVYVSRGRAGVSAILTILLVFAIFAAVVGGMVWGSAASDMSDYAGEFHDYQAMAERAKDNESLQHNAKVVDVQKFDNDHFRIEYELPITGKTYEKNEGVSFYVYDYVTAYNYVAAGEVLVALDRTELTKDTDSVPMDILTQSITDDGEYLAAQQEAEVGQTITLTALAVIAGLVVLMVLTMSTARKATAEQIATNEATKSETKTNAQSTTWRCRYCGSRNPADHLTCDGCGAKQD